MIFHALKRFHQSLPTVLLLMPIQEPRQQLRANAEISKVLGDKLGDEQFRKQLGGVIYEDMRQAEGGIGNPVTSLKNSPFASEAQLRAAMANPRMQEALKQWKALIQPVAAEMHQKLGGELSASGKETGAFANLIAVLDDKDPEGTGKPSSGPLATMKKGSAFSKERKFTGQEYDLDAKNMAQRMMTRNASEYQKRLMYDELERTGHGKLLKAGEEAPAGMLKLPNPITLRSIVTKNPDRSTETTGVSRWLAVTKSIAPEIRQALQLNTNWKDYIKENAPLINHLSQAAIKTQVSLGIDLGFHTFNDMLAVANSPKGLLALPSKVVEAAKATQDLIRNDVGIQDELAKMAESGISFRQDSLVGKPSVVLKMADNITRVTLNREFDNLVAKGTVKDVPAERRRYVNARAGQYNKRFMTWFQQGMQETGLGSFNVAGRNFNRLAIGNLTADPGVKASSKTEALRLRLTVAAGIATAALGIPNLVNIEKTGEAQPAGTQLGDMVVGKNADGTYKIINMRKWTMLDRGGRASGMGKVMSEQVLPRLKGEQPASWGQTVKDSASDIGRTALAPFSGPPVNLTSTALTGKTEYGFGYNQRSPGEKGPPYLKAAVSALNPVAGPVAVGVSEGDIGSKVASRFGSIFGYGHSQSPFGIIRTQADRFKQANKIVTSDFSGSPSQYLPLKQALANGDMEQAKSVYQQLLHEKSQEQGSVSDDEAVTKAKAELQKEFARMENYRFVNKEQEATFKASLSPKQREMYDAAVAQQKQIADKFQELQPKPTKNPYEIKAPKLRSGFKKYSEGDTIDRGGQQYTVTGFDTDGEPLVEKI